MALLCWLNSGLLLDGEFGDCDVRAEGLAWTRNGLFVRNFFIGTGIGASSMCMGKGEETTSVASSCILASRCFYFGGL